MENSKVCEFFMNGRKVWDESKVRATFNSTDADTILEIRIPQNSTRDRIAWVHSKDGQYSVRSGYHYWHLHHTGGTYVQ